MRPTELLPTTSGARPAPLATVPSYSSRPYPVSPPLNFSDFERIDKGGGDNSIYTVVHRPTGAPYSIKVIRYNQDGRLRREILREIEISRDLNNPNVVKCHGVFDHASEIQVLIEYMDGRSLEGVHVPDEPSLADLTFQILSGLSYLHHRKIAHGDIKPSNLLIGSVGLVKIAYFGLSRISTSAVKPNDSSTKAIAYSSPERINTDLSQGVYDGCAGDIWGIGLIILEVYLGIYPKTPEAPPTASREFRDFIARCLQTDPAKRWTAQQLLQHPFILLNTDINDNVDGNAADKTLSRNLKEIESKSDPFSRTGKPC